MVFINKRKVGAFYEERACKFLEENGLVIADKNFRCRLGEIDIIAVDGETLVFVEVKYRKNLKAGHPYEAVNFYKQKKICRVAGFYSVYKKPVQCTGFRFDVISILGEEISWFKNAFPYQI